MRHYPDVKPTMLYPASPETEAVQFARECLHDFKLRSSEDYADSMTSRALFTKECGAMLGL
jgi:hypothetical protein